MRVRRLVRYLLLVGCMVTSASVVGGTDTVTCKVAKDLSGPAGAAIICDWVSSCIVEAVAPPECAAWQSATTGCGLATLCGLLKGPSGGAAAGVKCVGDKWVVCGVRESGCKALSSLSSCVAKLADQMCKGHCESPVDPDGPGTGDPSCTRAAYEQPCGSGINPCDRFLPSNCTYHCTDSGGPPYKAVSYCGGSSACSPRFMDGRDCLNAHLARCPTSETMSNCNAACNRARTAWCSSGNGTSGGRR